jgi:hypothetical protein
MIDRVVTKLYVWGDDLDPERVTELLKIEPSEWWRKGDPKVVTTPQGEMKVLRVHKRGCWLSRIREPAIHRNLSKQLQYWCDRLHPREAALRELKRRGFETYIDCYVNDGAVVHADLSSDLLEGLGGLGVGIELSFYDFAALSADDDD